MALWTDLLDPAEMTGYVRADVEDYPANTTTLTPFLPNDFVEDIDARFTRGNNAQGEVAQFRAYDAETPIGSRPGFARATVELPPLGRKVRQSEYDKLRAQNPQAGQGEQGVRILLRDAARQARAIADRMELARGQVLRTGKFTLTGENGLTVEADFARSAGNSVATAVTWATATDAQKMADLASWADTYEGVTGARPATLVMSRRIFRSLRSTVPAPVLGYATTDMVQARLDEEGTGQIYIYDRTVRSGGAVTRVIPDDLLLMLPGPASSPDGTDLGATVWGRTLESQEPEYGIEAGDQPGIVAGSYKEHDPVSTWVKATAIGMPVLANPDLSFVADVFV